MELLQNPNVIYLLLAVGLALELLALASPGTGVLELSGLAFLVLAGILVAVFHIQVNLWSLLGMIIGAGLFALAVRAPNRYLLLALSIAALVISSAYLFAGEEWWLPGVDPQVALVVSAALGGFTWIAARKVIEAEAAAPRHDLSALIGAEGEARSVIHKEGSALVNGELWSARSSSRISNGAGIKVVGREGFVLEVEPLNPPAEPVAK